MANAVLAQSFLYSLSTTPLPLTHLIMPHDSKSLIRVLHDMPATATEHLTTLSIQVAYATDVLLKAIFSSFVHVEDLTLMVLLMPVHLSVSHPTDTYTEHVSEGFCIVKMHCYITRFRTFWLLCHFLNYCPASNVFISASHRPTLPWVQRIIRKAFLAERMSLPQVSCTWKDSVQFLRLLHFLDPCWLIADLLLNMAHRE